MSVNQRIEKILEIRNFSNEYIGKKIGVSRVTIGNFRKGRTVPSISFLKFLVEEHPGLNLNWLILGEGEMFLNSEKEETKALENRVKNLEGDNAELWESFENYVSKMEPTVQNLLKELEALKARLK